MTHELDNLSGGILITDVGGRILYANKVLTNRKGVSFSELLGKTPGQVWGGHMDAQFYKQMWQTLIEKRKSFSGNVKNVDSKGQTRIEGVHIAPIMNQDGEIEFFIELQPEHLTQNEGSHFSHAFESIIQNQQRHPEALLGLMKAWMGSHELDVSGAYTSPAHFLEALIKQHAEVNLDEDVTWIELAKKDGRYFGELYEKYQHKVFNYFLYRVGGNTSLAEDLTQETFVRAFDALSHFEYRDIHYLSYLLMVAHNLLLNHYRMAKPILLADMSQLSVNAESTAQKEAEVRLVWDAVHNLAPVEQKVLTMKYSKDFSVKEIAQKLKKSVNAVKLHLSRARKKLRASFL